MTMTPERWRKLKELFDQALKLDSPQRSEFLATACAGDDSLRREVEVLLHSHSEAKDFIEQPAAEKVASQILGEKDLLVAGQRVGRYEILGSLGSGGMGEVYLAQDSRLKRKVALKLLPAALTSDKERLQRFEQEARAASALNHPNILTIHEIGEHEGMNFIATEFIDGVTWRQKKNESECSVTEVLDVALQVASALCSAHEARIVHRDIKPENVMIRPDGIVKVLDFGLAKTFRTVGSTSASEVPTRLVETSPGIVMGTVKYMSPEQARGQDVDARTDIWSFGVVLYEMVARRLPFDGQTPSDVIAAILMTAPTPLKQLAPAVPDELQRIVEKTLRPKTEERYQDARELLGDLKKLRHELEFAARATSEGESGKRESGSQVSATIPPASVSTLPTPEVKGTSSAEYIVTKVKSHKLATAVVVLLLIGLVAGLVYILRPQPTPRPPAQRILSRLTFDAGLQSEPTWSPDGKFIAYSSDRSGNFDIWVQPVGEGNPVQVTKSEAHDWQPDWSRDGKRMVFRSEREGGGLFVVPAPTGGNERKISSFGYRPQWSPDGSQILFYSANLQNTPSPPKLYVVSLDGAPPREVFSEALSTMTGRLRAAWHPDGKRVSFWVEQRTTGLTFVTVALESGVPVKSEISARVDQQMRSAGVDLFDFRWAPTGDALYFEGISRGVRNIWKVTVEPENLRWIDGPERLTTGPGPDGNLIVSPDGSKLAFTTRTEHTRLWSLPFNAAIGRVRSEGQPVTPAGIDALSFDVSRDGRKIAFVTERAGKRELWERVFANGSDKSLAASEGFSRSAPRWSRDGLRLAYVRSRLVSQESTEYEHTLEHAIAVVDINNGTEQVLTSAHRQQGWSWDWTADQQSILSSSARSTPGHWGLYLYPLAAAPNAEGQAKLISLQPGYNAFNARFSPDEKWICFIGIKTDDAGDGAIFVIPAAGGEWTRISEGSDFNDKPRWSPDGRMIYFISNRTGFFNVWGRRFDPAHGQPMGEAVRVTDFESPSRMISPRIVPIELSLSADRLVVPIMEVSGSIWILENVNR